MYLSTLIYLTSDVSNFVKMQFSTYIHRHIAITIHIYLLTSRYFNLNTFITIFLNWARFTLKLTNVSTWYFLGRLRYIIVFPSPFRYSYIERANYMKINLTTCKLMSGDISIDWMQITSWYNTRYVSINVDLSDFRCFKLC